MNKIILACASGMLALCAGAATATPTLSEMRELEKEGKAFKMSRPIPTRSNRGANLLTTHSGEGALLSRNEQKSTANPLRIPSNLTQKGVNLYGYLSYTLGSEVAGMYEFNEDGFSLFWEDPMVALGGPQSLMGWYVDGMYWGISYTALFGYMVNYDEFVIDFEEGELLSYESHLYDTNLMFVNVAMNPDDDRVYGFAFDFDQNGNLFWASAERDFIAEAEAIRPADDFYCYALAYNPEDGYFYGITDEQKFIRISTQGNYIELADLSNYGFAEYITGMIYSKEVDGFYWGAYFEDDSSALAILSPTGNVEFVEEYPWGPNFTALIIPEDYEVNPDKPGRAKIEEINFSNGSLKGNIEYTLPERFLNGKVFPDNAILSYVTLLDNEFYNMGTGKPGEQITVDYDVKEKGYHTFGITPTYNRVSGLTTEQEFWLGNDTPFPPTGVTLTKTEVSWNPVISTGIHGGYVDPAKVTYKVYIEGELKGSTKETSMAISLPEDKPFSAYFATVTAVFDGAESGAGQSNYVASGEALTLPFYMLPTPEEFILFTVLDENNDGIVWQYNTTNQAIAINASRPGVKVNDYAFLPPIEFPETENYFSLKFLAACWNAVSTKYDYLEVVWATEPSVDMIGGVILPSYTPTSGYFENIETFWKAPQAGKYYIGFRCISEADQNGMLLKNFEIKQSQVTDNSPATPEIVSVVPAKDGVLSADVTVKLPSETYSGKAYEASKELTGHVWVNGTDEYTVSGKAGEEVKVTVNTIQGENFLTVYVTDGTMESPTVSSSVTTGISIPANPKNLKFTVSEDMMSATLTWDPVTESAEPGGYVDPSGVSYAIYMGLNYGFGDNWNLYAEDIKTTSITIALDEDDPQALYRLGVASYNIAGTTGEFVGSVGRIMGPAYRLPFVENLQNPEYIFETTPWFMESTFNGVKYKGYWATDLLSNIGYISGEDRPVMIGFTYDNNSSGLLSMPRISTKGVTAAEFSMTCLTGADVAQLTVYGEIAGKEGWIEVGKINAVTDKNEELKTFTIALPESLLDRDLIALYLMTEFESFNQIFVFTDISITGDTGVEIIPAADGNIFGGENIITVIGHEGEDVTVNALDGKQIIKRTADSDRMTISVAKGIYAVSAGNQKVKVIVR